MPCALAFWICEATSAGSCEEYPTFMCLGWPNHASYRAITCGDVPVALYFSGTGWVDSGPEHPWGSRNMERSARKPRWSIDVCLEAIGKTWVCRSMGVGAATRAPHRIG